MSALRLAYARKPNNELPEAPRSDSAILPRPCIRPDALSYHRVRLAEAGPFDMPLLGKIYECWSSVWRTTLYELDKVVDVPSDELTRQDEIGALFHEYECIGLSCLRWMHLDSPIFLDDSYFRVWPKDAIRAAAKHGGRACILSNLTVAPAYRRATEYNVAEMVLGLAVDRFAHSEADSLIGTPRADRRVNELAYKMGFVPLAHDVVHHGVNVDLVRFPQKAGGATATLSPSAESIVSMFRMPERSSP
jgi:hypothetical protein